jgi:hypothetical protein
MATSGRGSGVVGYNVQVAVDTLHHLIVTHEVTNTGSDRSQLSNIAPPPGRFRTTKTQSRTRLPHLPLMSPPLTFGPPFPSLGPLVGAERFGRLVLAGESAVRDRRAARTFASTAHRQLPN